MRDAEHRRAGHQRRLGPGLLARGRLFLGLLGLAPAVLVRIGRGQGRDVLFGQARDPRQNLGRDVLLIGGDLRSLEHAVVVEVERLEEGHRVGLELLFSEDAIVVGVDAVEPDVDRIGGVGAAMERLAHRADEHIDAAARHGRLFGGRAGAGAKSGAGGEDEKPRVHIANVVRHSSAKRKPGLVAA